MSSSRSTRSGNKNSNSQKPTASNIKSAETKPDAKLNPKLSNSKIKKDLKNNEGNGNDELRDDIKNPLNFINLENMVETVVNKAFEKMSDVNKIEFHERCSKVGYKRYKLYCFVVLYLLILLYF